MVTGVLVVILLLACGLRFYQLDTQSLWNDEGTSVAVAQRDLATIARDAANDIHPPLYYWLLSGWVRLFGTSETAVRSLSALLGVVLVALAYALGRRLAGPGIGLAAAFLSAVHPFQVAYSQEARMYILLAVLTAGTMLALVRIVQGGSWPSLITLTFLEAAGLYTHYSFLFIIFALNLAAILWLIRIRRQMSSLGQARNWVLSQVAVLLLYLPWLSTAIRQVTTWPSPERPTALLAALADTWRWLVFGPTLETGEVIVPLLVAGLLAAIGLVALGMHRRWNTGLLALWLGLPVLLMFALGLFREAYLKFLLVATPALSLLLAGGLTHDSLLLPRGTQRAVRITYTVVRSAVYVLILLVPTVVGLHRLYADPSYARDDYRGIAAYLQAVGKSGDAIVLNAPGQNEVFGYYYQGNLPVYPLPEDRPLDPETTESALASLARPASRVFAILWATEESDPERFVESWLDERTYKALDTWYGNVRLAVYAVPAHTPSEPDHSLDLDLLSGENGDKITLVGYSLLNDRLAAGDIAQLTLFWQADRTPSRRYKVFVHALDEADQIVGQRDAEPGGGARLTTDWQPGELVADNYGLPIHPATPPGRYRIEVGLYDPETGQRLLTPEGASQVWLEPVSVDRPQAPPPLEALGMQHSTGATFGEVSLLGYDLYKFGQAHEPDAPVRPGDVLQASLYWRAETQPTQDWQVEIALVDPDGREWAVLRDQPVRGYATSLWRAGDVWRGQFAQALPGNAPPGRYRLQVQLTAPGGTGGAPFLSEPVQVRP